MRNNIQKMKMDMANEVIDAGRFDMETTMAERRQHAGGHAAGVRASK